jgi:hypothetical protein
MTGFGQGVYAVFNITGHVLVRITYTGGLNAVLSGLFFKTSTPPPPPPTVSISTPLGGATLTGPVTVTANASATAGMSSVQFRVDGNNIGAPIAGTGPIFSTTWNTTTTANGPHAITAVAVDAQNQTSTSAAVNVTVSNALVPPAISITAPTPGTVSGTVAVTANATATAGMSSVQFKLDGANLGAAIPGTGPTFTYQWDTTGLTGVHILTAVATDQATQTTTSSAVNVTVSNVGPSATFVTLDTTTKGSWKGVYGSDGYIIPGDSTSPPSYGSLTGPTGGQTYVWLSTTTDARGVIKGASATDRIASTFYSSTNFTFGVNLGDSQVHQLALYFWDYENFGRTETIQILNAANNAVLASRNMTGFGGGVWAVFNVSGNVIVKISNNGGISAVLGGLFFKTAAPLPPPPTISLIAPIGGTTVTGSTTLTATASATGGMSSVQFKLDGVNLGAPVPGTGPTYNFVWNSTASTNGSHNLTAVALDAQNQTTTSETIAITTSNVVTPPAINITTPANGASISGTVSVTANATATGGMSSVQFKLDGANLGAPVTGAGPTFTYSWDTSSVPGPHILSAVATDALAQTTTSASVNVTVGTSGTAASFVSLDTATKGNWKGVYGTDGYLIPNDSNVPPSYATLTLPGAAGPPFTWAATTTDVRALIKGASPTDRIASTYYTANNANPFTFGINITDGNSHQLAMYVWDLENAGRAETITILNAANNTVLATKALTGFGNGTWAVFNISGNVLVRVTYNGGINAVLSGLFFKTLAPPPPPPVVAVTAPTAGSTQTGAGITLTANATGLAGIASVQFKVDGANVGVPVTGAGPNYSTTWDTTALTNGSHSITAVALDNANQTTTSAAVSVTTSNVPAPPAITLVAPAPGNVSGSVTLTANATGTAGIQSVQFKVDGSNLGAPVTGGGPLYSVSWDTTGITGSHNLSAVATDTLNQTTTSAVISVNVNAPNAISATFIKTDTTTKGNWKGVYGADGYIIPNDSNVQPGYASATIGGLTSHTWFPSIPNDPRALLKGNSATDRIASCYYNGTTINVPLFLTDGQLHQIALYFLDFDTSTRRQTVDILDATTNAVLVSRQLNTSFNGGVWLVYNIRGNVVIRVTNTGGTPNVLLSGVFFRSFSGLLNPSVNITAPLSGNQSGPVTVTANATSAQGIASVQFLLDGSPLGPLQTNGGPSYSTPWATPAVANGVHTLSAVATDSLGLASTSAPVSVTVSNGPAPVPSATFLTQDVTTKGTWVGTYGQEGYVIANIATVLPFYATLDLGGATPFTWNAANPTTDIPGLMKGPTNPERIGSTFRRPFLLPGGGSPILADVNFVDYQQHRMAIYFLDWHHDIRTHRVEILDGDTNAVLDSRDISAFSQGKYLVYNLQGHVKIRVTMIVTDANTTADSTVMSALFFGQ